MDLSIPPTPLPGTLPLGIASRNQPFFGPKCLPKPLRYLVLSYDATFHAFQTTSKPIFDDFRPLAAIKTTHFTRQGRRFLGCHYFLFT